MPLLEHDWRGWPGLGWTPVKAAMAVVHPLRLGGPN